MTREALEAAFDRDMHRILEGERELNLNSARFRQMIYEHGGVKAAHKLLEPHREFPPGTFGFLRANGKPELTLEHWVLQAQYHTLFTDQEREIAKYRLEKGD